MGSTSKYQSSLADLIRQTVPGEAEMARRHKMAMESAQENKTCITHWYPAIKNIVNTPDTMIVPVSTDLQFALAGDPMTPELKEELDSIVCKFHVFASKVGYPVFIKNSLFSSKHGWNKTCFIENEDANIVEHIANICSDWYCVSNDFSLYLVFRAFIKTEPAFHAFYGGMPVTKERRYFIEGGKVIGHHPYWPPESIESPSVDNWEHLLDRINFESPSEITVLTSLSEQIGEVLPGAWSVDWLFGDDGIWYCIDMAEKQKSYVWMDYLKKTGQITE